MSIIIIGFMASGKSTVAKVLASRLKYPLLEMDELVLQKTGAKSIRNLFAQGGELLLRETEIAIAKEYGFVKSVISTGGGVILNKIILDYFKQKGGQTFFLNSSFSTLATRLANDQGRPLCTNRADLESLYYFRTPLYRQYADQIIETDDKSIEDIAEEILGYVS